MGGIGRPHHHHPRTFLDKIMEEWEPADELCFLFFFAGVGFAIAGMMPPNEVLQMSFAYLAGRGVGYGGGYGGGLYPPARYPYEDNEGLNPDGT